ncbi:hypothetical protein BV22DRAFT_849246 [Leucogyrophana mollusca]|uniref:Uncharacterized protein n=1 Tax=Leucogyrophana mollusca TaxID=85980 RepID=A0ACB8B281_9AGAM|nr:hypothetical protein BV22DRAFT_849246 [Leucogyrophana mollusca]
MEAGRCGIRARSYGVGVVRERDRDVHVVAAEDVRDVIAGSQRAPPPVRQTQPREECPRHVHHSLAKAIDSVLVDRANIIQYVDLPSSGAVYEIPRSALWELVRKGIVQETPPLPNPSHQPVPALNEALYCETPPQP